MQKSPQSPIKDLLKVQREMFSEKHRLPETLPLPKTLTEALHSSGVRANLPLDDCLMKVVFSNKEASTLYGVGHSNTPIIRYKYDTEKLICRSRVEIPRCDWIGEDKWGKIWVVALGSEQKILKFNSMLYFEEFYDIPIKSETIVYPWANCCTFDSLKTKLYFPFGMNKIGVLTIHKEGSLDDEEESPKKKEDKSASITVLKDTVSRISAFDMSITADNGRLVIDLGARSIFVIDLQGGPSMEEHIDASKEKLSSPLCLTNPYFVLFSGKERHSPIVSLYRLKNLQLQLISSLVFESSPQTNEIVVAMRILETNLGVDRVLVATSHRRLYVVQITSKGVMKKEAEFDLSIPGRGKIEQGVRTLYAKNQYALFFTDNKDKTNTVVKFIGF